MVEELEDGGALLYYMGEEVGFVFEVVIDEAWGSDFSLRQLYLCS